MARGEDVSLKGRKSQYPVYAYSLSWHPEQAPDRAHMIEIATESLKVNGLDQGYEVLMVAHNDEPHPHIHVIVNRVHPETGIMAPLSNDYLKLSRWAEAYERDRGKIYCEQRVENNERRRRGEYVKDTRSVFKSDFYRWRAEQTKQGFERRQDEAQTLSDTHKQQRDDLYQWKEALIRNRRDELKDQRRPLWADLYKKQAFESKLLRREHEAAWNKAGYFTSHRDVDALNRRRIIADAFNERVSGQQQREDLAQRHEQERLALAGFFKDQTKTEIKKINDGYRRRLETLHQQQRTERREQQRQHSKESQDRAQEIAEGRDAERFDPQRYREERRERKREEFREAGRDILEPKSKGSRETENPREREEDISGERDRYEDRGRERERQRLRQRGPRPKGPKPPRFRR